MARCGRLLIHAQWEKSQPLLPKRPKRPKGGRPPKDDRKVLEGILWILGSGARWRDLPDEFPSPADVLATTAGLGRARGLAHHLARILGGAEPTRATGLERVLSGRQFCFSEKRGSKVGKTKRGKGTKWSGGRRRGYSFWESSFTLHPRTRSGSRKKRSRRSA